MKRLLFFIVSLNNAGAQRALVDLANNLDLNKYSITIQTLFDEGSLKNELKKEIRYRTIIKPGKNTLINRIKSFYYQHMLSDRILYRKYIDDNYDIEVAFLEGSCTRILSRSTNIKSKKIAWVHTCFSNHFVSQKSYKNFDEHLNAYKRFDQIVCVSETARDAFIKKMGIKNNVVTKYNVLDESVVFQKSNQYNDYSLKNDCLNFVAVGNMRPEKSYDRLLRVCRRLVEEGKLFHLYICGSGSEFEKIKDLCQKLDLTPFVDLLGAVSNPYPLVKNSDCLICSSLEEGYSTVVVEACILEIPTITTSCSGMNEILDNGKYGIIVPNDEDSLYRGIKNLIENPNILKMFKKRLNKRGTFFSKEKNLFEIEKIFQS